MTPEHAIESFSEERFVQQKNKKKSKGEKNEVILLVID